MSRLILAGDIGGTKSNIACFSLEDGPLRPRHEKSYRTNDMPSFRGMIENFLDEMDRPHIEAACFGVAGPIVDRRSAVVVNVNWPIDARDIEVIQEGLHVELVNDMVAMAYGVLVLPEESYFTLNAGVLRPEGARGVIAAGTGLGKSMLVKVGKIWAPVPSEGGHVDFSPNNAIEVELQRYLWNIYGRLSAERVISGPGLVNIYKFLRETGRAEEPSWLAREFEQSPDPGVLITRNGVKGTDPLCAQALDLFVHAYGSQAGDLALTCVATGGIYLGGGIAPNILPVLEAGSFMSGFINKGRMSQFVSEIPVKVILEPRAPLYGAAYHAFEMAEEKQ